MKENRVHQRCIAAGLKYICANENFDHVIVMDADGEDRPEELNDFYKKAIGDSNITITGNRYKRSEGIVFRTLYLLHKLLTLIFTGKLIKFGNFTCLPKDHVKQLIEKSYLWNSYSSSIVKTINNRTFIPSIRGVRYVQPSKMNFFDLVRHSLSIISVFKTTVLVRSIIFLAVYIFLVLQHISLVTLIPVGLVIFMVFSVFALSGRENITELNNSLENINNIENLK